MSYQIKAMYSGTVRFEISVDVDGNNYLVIFGEHINGLFCCIPIHGISCEMAYPTETGFNTEALCGRGVPYNSAAAIADAICKTATAMYDYLE